MKTFDIANEANLSEEELELQEHSKEGSIAYAWSYHKKANFQSFLNSTLLDSLNG